MLPPVMKHPPASAGKPASRANSSSTCRSAATAPGASSHDSAENVIAPTTASIHTEATDGDAGMNARKRELSSENP